jgi:mortality factor 4-like protein 1
MKEAFQVNDTVLAYHGMVVYDAKVLKVDHGQGVVPGGGGGVTPNTQYYVHYQGWAKKWDEWVRHDLVLHDTPANRAVQQKAKQEMAKVKKEKSALARKKKISTAGMDTAGARKSPFKKMKVNPETETEEMPPPEDVGGGRGGAGAKSMTVQMPFALKKQLVEDWKQITHEPHKLVPLPRKPNVRQVSALHGVAWVLAVLGSPLTVVNVRVAWCVSDHQDVPGVQEVQGAGGRRGSREGVQERRGHPGGGAGVL